MASELEALLIRLDADTRKLRVALAQAESGVAGFEKSADKSLRKAETRFQQFGDTVAGKLRGVVATIAATFAVGSTMSNIVDVAALNKAANMLGMTAEQYQRLAAVAGDAGMKSEAMTEALKNLGQGLAEVHMRSGKFYEFIRHSLPTVEAQLRTTKTTADAMDVVAETVRRLSSVEERNTFIKKALGDQAVELSAVLAKGKAGLKDAADEADKYGQVISEKAVKNTAELNKEINGLTDTLSSRFRESLGSVAPYITAVVKGIREGLRDRGITSNDLIAALGGDEKARAKFFKRGEQAGAEYAQGFSDSAKKMVEAGLAMPAKDALKLQVRIPDFDTQVHFEAADALRELNVKVLQDTERTTEAITAEYEKEVERFRRMLADKKIDEAQFAQAREQLSISMGDKIKAAYDKEREEVRKLGEEFSSAMEGAFGSAFAELLESGKVNFRQFTASLIADLARVYVQTQLIRPLVGALGGALSGGLGGIGGIAGAGGASGLASFFGGFRADGGPVSAGKSYVVGERGPELFTPSASGNITPNGAGGGNVYNIDARGAEIGVEERIRAAMLAIERERQSPVAAVSQYHRRFPTRRAA